MPEICTNIEACIFYNENKVDDIHKKRTVVCVLHTNKSISFVKKILQKYEYKYINGNFLKISI